MMKSDRKVLVYFAPVSFRSPAQRPHFFATFVRDQFGWDVLWVEPPPGRLPSWSDFRRPKDYGSSTQDDWPCTVVRTRWLPVDPIPLLRQVNDILSWPLFRMLDQQLASGRDLRFAVGRPTRLALKVLQRWPGRALLYDAMDDFPRFYRGLSAAHNEKIEMAIARAVPQILISSSALAGKFVDTGASVMLVPNAFDENRCTQIAARVERRVVGYMGTIGAWFDWESVIDAARRRPGYEFRLVGPMYTQPNVRLPKNIRLLGAVSHEAAIQMAAGFDVGMIPFRRTPLTDAVDPVKYYEYRALGLPVCSSGFGEMSRRSGESEVFVYNEPHELAGQIDAALAAESDAAGILQFRAQNSWHHRLGAIDPLFVNGKRGPRLG